MSCCGGHDHDGGHHGRYHEMTEEDIAEMNHFREIVVSFKNYKKDALVGIGTDDKKTRTAVEINSYFTTAVIADSDALFGTSVDNSAGAEEGEETRRASSSRYRSSKNESTEMELVPEAKPSNFVAIRERR